MTGDVIGSIIPTVIPSNLAGLGDWRSSIPGLAAGWRRGDNDEYLTLVGSDVDSWTDYVGGAVVSAAGTSRRPSIVGTGVQFDRVSAQALDGATTVAPIMGGASSTVVLRTNFVGGTGNHMLIAAGAVGDSSRHISVFAFGGGGSTAIRRVVTTPVDAGTASLATGMVTIGWTYDGATLSQHRDGAVTGSAADSRTMTALDRVSLGSGYVGDVNNFSSQIMYEAMVFSRVLSASELALVHARLVAEYP